MPTANPDSYPPDLNTDIHDPAVTSKIGSKSTWIESNFFIFNQFAVTGDWMRTASTACPYLEAVINADVRTVIYAGDADYIVNYMGVEAMVRARVLSFFSYLLPNLSSYAPTDHVAL